MRYTEFKPLLIETDTSGITDLSAVKAMNQLDVISNIAGQIPEEKASILDKLADKLESTNARIAQFVSNLLSSGKAEEATIDDSPSEDELAQQPELQSEPAAEVPAEAPPEELVEPQPAEVPVEEPEEEPAIQEADELADPVVGTEERAARLQATIEETRQNIIYYDSLKMSAEIKKRIIADLTKNLNEMVATLTKLKEVASELKITTEKLRAAEEFIQNVNDLLVDLGNKVQDYVAITPDEYDALSKRAQALHDNARNFTTTFRQSLFSMVLDISKQNQQVDKQQIQDFLQACLDGNVINMISLVSADRGNVRDHVNKEWQPMMDLFAKQKVFSWSPGKTSGAVGPGEMALCMMGSPSNKAKTKGDLEIDGEDYEIKAGADSGGRLNSDKILKGPAAWPVWKAGIEKIVKDGAPKDAKWTSRTKKGEEIQTSTANYSANTFNKTKKGVKEASKYNFNKQGLTKLNDEILIYSTPELTYDLFANTFSTLITNLSEVESSYVDSKGNRFKGVKLETIVWETLFDDGTIDVDGIMKAYTRLAYESYNRENDVESILFLNTRSLDYTIARNGKDMLAKLASGDIKITSGFNFNDSQQSASPAYLSTVIK